MIMSKTSNVIKKYMKTGKIGSSKPKGRDKARKKALATAFAKMGG